MAPDRFLELGPQHHEVGRPCWDVVLVGDPLLGIEPGGKRELNDKVWKWDSALGWGFLEIWQITWSVLGQGLWRLSCQTCNGQGGTPADFLKTWQKHRDSALLRNVVRISPQYGHSVSEGLLARTKTRWFHRLRSRCTRESLPPWKYVIYSVST